jgi:hypothetical protein
VEADRGSHAGRRQVKRNVVRTLLAGRRVDVEVVGVREQVGVYALADPPTVPAVERRSRGQRRQVVRRLRVSGAPAWLDRRWASERRSMMHRRSYVVAGSYLASRGGESGQG